MVNYEAHLDAIFSALSDQTRRSILTTLASHEATVSEIAQPFDMSLPAVSKHLGVLERAGLLVREADGRLRRCRIRPEGLRTATEWVEFHRRMWEQQLDQLAQLLEAPTTAPEDANRNQPASNEVEQA